MKLFELLDRKVNFKIDTNASNNLIIHAIIDNEEYEFGAISIDTKLWAVDFLLKSAEEAYDLTNKHHELEVFSFVKASLEYLIKHKKPETIKFSADKADNNRARLYDRLLKKFLSSDYTYKVTDTSHSTKFILTRKAL